jgi:hypothetical protein
LEAVGQEEEEEVMLPSDRLQDLLSSKDVDNSVPWEFWSIIDNALVIYDGNDPPHWLPTEAERDDDGNTKQFVERSSVGSQEEGTS